MNKPKMTKVVCAMLIAASLLAVAAGTVTTNDRTEIPEVRVILPSEERRVVIHEFDRPVGFGGCMLYGPKLVAVNEEL